VRVWSRGVEGAGRLSGMGDWVSGFFGLWFLQGPNSCGSRVEARVGSGLVRSLGDWRVL